MTVFESLGPLGVSLWLWIVWFVGWELAAIVTELSRRAVARASLLAQASHHVPMMLGAFLLFAGGQTVAGVQIGGRPLWALPDWAGWTATGLVALGLAFTCWARLALGSLWSSAVRQREGHTLVSTGPYAIVRHPIYTGLILAGWALAIEFAGPLNMLGAAIATLALWQKARVEERFLGDQLGGAAYAAYRARAPMLIPFWR